MAERKPFVWGASGVELLQSGDTLPVFGGGDMVLLSTTTVTEEVATVEFTGLTDEYFKYIIEIDNAKNSITAASCYVVTQVFNSGAWITTGSDYYSVFPGTSSTAYQNNYIGYLSGDLGAVYFSGEITMTNPCPSKLSHRLTSSVIAYAAGSGAITVQNGAAWDKCLLVRNPSFTTITGVRVLCSAGNILEGTFKLYGLKA